MTGVELELLTDIDAYLFIEEDLQILRVGGPECPPSPSGTLDHTIPNVNVDVVASTLKEIVRKRQLYRFPPVSLHQQSISEGR